MAAKTSRLKWLADHVGAVLTLIGVPAALFGVYAFGGRTIDTFTAPDVGLSYPRLTMRCFLRFTDQAELNAYRGGDTEVGRRVCDRSGLSVGFLATIANDDRIPRTITGVSAILRLPDGAPAREVEFELPWQVTDEVERGVANTRRRTLPEIVLEPGSARSIEIWIEQAQPVDQRIAWREVRRWMADPEGAQAGDVVAAEVFLRDAGADRPIASQVCRFSLRPASLETFRGWTPFQQRAFTGGCGRL